MSGLIEINPGKPVPKAIAFTLKNEMCEPILEPMIAPINGYLNLRFTPNILVL